MIPEIISFSKSMACRLEEFENLLSDVDSPCSDIKEVWSSIFEDLVIPNCDWEALWLMSEDSCMKYDLMHPTAVIVTVESYDWDEMAATVTVTGVQNDIVLPSVLDVPVIELHPIKNQDYDEYDLRIIADWLDKCRYFFKYLWYPWDMKSKVKISDWCSNHLQNRLQIQCNIQNGIFSKNVTHYYKSLVAESRDMNKSLADISGMDLSSNERIKMIKTCFRRKILKMELDFFEEPELRNDLMTLRMGRDCDDEDQKKEARFIWEGGSIDTLLLHLSTVRSSLDNDIAVKVSLSLQDALDCSSAGDYVYLPPGSHVLKSLCGLESGGVIKGVGSSTEVKIVADFSGLKRAILLGCLGGIDIQNVTIMREEGTAIQVFEKTLKITNCRLISVRPSSARALIVLSEGSLFMENCEIVGFSIGITLQKGSKAFVSNSRITDCSIGLKVGKGADAKADELEISDCSRSAICVECDENELEMPKIGDLDLLSDLGDDFKFNFGSLKLKNNKSNLLITNSLDSFTSDSFISDGGHETITISDEENSDCSTI